ncbi:hypothetical protein F4604DRAFT_1878934 [Suillus subluteus]|nr:hypothetical protein F4604DRAFT_1878934 [Suillus subluteus]
MLCTGRSAGVQVQLPVISVFHITKERGLKITLVLTKVTGQLQSTSGVDLRVEATLRAIVDHIPLRPSCLTHYRIMSCHTRKKYEITEIDMMHPEEATTLSLQPGQVSYIACNMTESSEGRITVTLFWLYLVSNIESSRSVSSLIASVFPVDNNPILMDRNEYDMSIITAAPTAPYKGQKGYISNPMEFPDTLGTSSKVKQVEEPVVNAPIIVPEEYMWEMNVTSEMSVGAILTCTSPLSEIVTDFFDQPESRSSGYASVNMAVYISLTAFILIVHRLLAQHEVGREWIITDKMIPYQLFKVLMQAAVRKKIIARETLSAMRAGITAGLYGSYHERKLKHLEN